VLQVPVDHQPRLAETLAEVRFETTVLPAAALGPVAAARHGLILEEATYVASKP
jgi:hypothetical protein